MRVRLAATVVGAALAATVLLAGCTTDPLAGQYASGSGQGYISGDGAYTEISPSARQSAVTFSGLDDAGATVTNASFAGKVYVVNFWYAACPPCRAEAPDLVAVSAKYPAVPFLGVNISDSADVVRTFAAKFGIPYPSIIDADTASVQLAFAGAVAPNAVPTTLVIDRHGRVAARISGLLKDQSILAGMIDRVVAEGQ